MLMELLFWRKQAARPQCFFLLTTVCRYFSDISHYEFGKMFVTRITLSHAFKKNTKHLKMISNGILAQNFLALWFGLWTLVPRARAALFEYMQFVRVFENITFCSLFTNCLRPFHDFNHQSNQQQPHLPLLIGDMRWFYDDHSIILEWCLRLSLSDSFKCFHTADVFAALVRASIWSRNVIVRYKLLGLFAYSQFGCRTFGASLVLTPFV